LDLIHLKKTIETIVFVAEIKKFQNCYKVYVDMTLVKCGKENKLLKNSEMNLVLKFCVCTAE